MFLSKQPICSRSTQPTVPHEANFEENLEAFVTSPAVGQVIVASDVPKTNDKAPITHISEVEPEPKTNIDVQSSTHRAVQEDAMARELDGLVTNMTFSPATKPRDRKFIGSKRMLSEKTTVSAR